MGVKALQGRKKLKVGGQNFHEFSNKFSFFFVFLKLFMDICHCLVIRSQASLPVDATVKAGNSSSSSPLPVPLKVNLTYCQRPASGGNDSRYE